MSVLSGYVWCVNNSMVGSEFRSVKWNSRRSHFSSSFFPFLWTELSRPLSSLSCPLSPLSSLSSLAWPLFWVSCSVSSTLSWTFSLWCFRLLIFFSSTFWKVSSRILLLYLWLSTWKVSRELVWVAVETRRSLSEETLKSLLSFSSPFDVESPPFNEKFY